MIAHGANRENWDADIRKRDGPAGGYEPALGEIVIEKELTQIFGMHAVGMRVESAFQAIRSVIGGRSPSRYSRRMRDQMRSLERSIWKAPDI